MKQEIPEGFLDEFIEQEESLSIVDQICLIPIVMAMVPIFLIIEGIVRLKKAVVAQRNRAGAF
jgi:hypothetical protein